MGFQLGTRVPQLARGTFEEARTLGVNPLRPCRLRDPWVIAVSVPQQFDGRLVVERPLAVGVDENVGIERDHPSAPVKKIEKLVAVMEIDPGHDTAQNGFQTEYNGFFNSSHGCQRTIACSGVAGSGAN
jgi:hypothetical protein